MAGDALAARVNGSGFLASPKCAQTETKMEAAS